jgi:N-acetylneuraminate synthase
MKLLIIAEIGCNHKGDMGIAHEMIKIAAQFCQVDIVKFQKRNPKELLTTEEYNAQHLEPYHSYGRTYGEHRVFLEFDLEQHRQLKKWCEEWGVVYSTSVWDMTSSREIVSLEPKMIKIPSACNLKFDMLDYLCKEYEGKIHLSFGMTTQAEEEQIVSFFAERDRAKDLIVYGCTSGYPVPFEDICLKELIRIRNKFEKRVEGIGFSGHHLGIAADIAALAYGAKYFERHFTLDRTWKGTDHAASLEPDGMRRLARDLRNVSKAITYKQKEILDIEEAQRKKLKRRQ